MLIMIKTLLLVGVGGGLGSIMRYITSLVSEKFFQSLFPLATFASNILGCFILGLFLGLFERHLISNPDMKFLLVIGFCGGYTTFSAFTSENLSMLQSGNYTTAFLYISLSVITGLLSLFAGLMLTR